MHAVARREARFQTGSVGVDVLLACRFHRNEQDRFDVPAVRPQIQSGFVRCASGRKQIQRQRKKTDVEVRPIVSFYDDSLVLLGTASVIRAINEY
jgi:hypothetical protein